MKNLLTILPALLIVLSSCQSSDTDASNNEVLASLTSSTTERPELANNGVFSDPLWNDGKAEIAFYQASRTRNQYGKDEKQDFLIGTYLVKHDYDFETESKARSESTNKVPAFKSAQFFEFESGAYQYKRSWVTNFAIADMAPLKSSYNNFDWCSNQYKEMSFDQNQNVKYLMRSDDYGNVEKSYASSDAYPVDEIRVLVRSMDATPGKQLEFKLILDSGEIVGVVAQHMGKETIKTEAGDMETAKVQVVYDRAVPSALGVQSDESETYWVSTRPDRLLVQMQGDSGRYKMSLVEDLRSPYWKENFYPNLERVKTRP